SAVLLERRDLRANSLSAEVVDEVVVAVYAVPGGNRRMPSRKVVEIPVDEPGEFFGRRRRAPRAEREETEQGGKHENEGSHMRPLLHFQRARLQLPTAFSSAEAPSDALTRSPACPANQRRALEPFRALRERHLHSTRTAERGPNAWTRPHRV